MNKVILIFFLSIGIVQQNYAQYNQAAVWGSVQGEISLAKNLEAKIETGYRLTNNIETTDKWYAESGIQFEINKTFRISAEYRFTEKYIVDDRFYAERHRIMLKFRTTYRNKAYRFSWTTKYQLNFFDPAEHNWNSGKQISHFRNRFQFKYKKKNAIVFPYFYYEHFMPLSQIDLFYLNTDAYRLGGGIEFELHKNHSLKAFMLYDKEKESRQFVNTYIYGLAYIIKI